MAGFGLLAAQGAIALFQAAAIAPAPNTPLPDTHLADLAGAFVALCVDGEPTAVQSVERARATGWVNVPGQEEDPAVPVESREIVLSRPDMILVLMPPRGPSASRLCEVAMNFPHNLSLEELAADVAARLQLGPHRLKQAGPTLFAQWLRAPGLELRAGVPSGDGPRTHVLMAIRPPTPDGP